MLPCECHTYCLPDPTVDTRGPYRKSVIPPPETIARGFFPHTVHSVGLLVLVTARSPLHIFHEVLRGQNELFTVLRHSELSPWPPEVRPRVWPSLSGTRGLLPAPGVASRHRPSHGGSAPVGVRPLLPLPVGSLQPSGRPLAPPGSASWPCSPVRACLGPCECNTGEPHVHTHSHVHTEAPHMCVHTCTPAHTPVHNTLLSLGFDSLFCPRKVGVPVPGGGAHPRGGPVPAATRPSPNPVPPSHQALGQLSFPKPSSVSGPDCTPRRGQGSAALSRSLPH